MFSLKQVRPKVFLLHFDRQYDLAMHFVRYQEYYESPKWRGKFFTILEYMDWYAKEYGKGVFSYPGDRSGFNIPSEVLDKMDIMSIPDWNQYDAFMHTIERKICQEVGNKFYLIGTYGDDSKHLDHELSHAYYYLYPEYKRLQKDRLWGKWKLTAGTFGLPAEEEELPGMDVWERDGGRVLREQGYCEAVIMDELIAYAATGPSKELKQYLSVDVSSTAESVFLGFDQKIRESCHISK